MATRLKGFFFLLFLIAIPTITLSQTTPAIRHLAMEAAILEKVDFYHLLSICAAESQGFLTVPETNRKGEQGYCQVRKSTWRQFKCLGNPHGLQGTFRCAAKIIKKSISKCNLRSTAFPYMAFFYNTGRCARSYPKNSYVSRTRYYYDLFARRPLVRRRITLAMID